MASSFFGGGGSSSTTTATFASSSSGPATTGMFGSTFGVGSGGSGGSGTIASSTASTSTTATSTPAATLELPPFDSVFVHVPLWTRLNQLLGVLSTTSTTGSTSTASGVGMEIPLAGQELAHCISNQYRSILLHPPLPPWTNQPLVQQQTTAMYQKLCQVPTVSLQTTTTTGGVDGGGGAPTSTTTTTLTPTMCAAMYQLALDLGIPYPPAASLYAQVCGDLTGMHQTLQKLGCGRLWQSPSTTMTGHDDDQQRRQQQPWPVDDDDPIGQACRDFYGQDCLLPWKAILRLVHARVVAVSSFSSSADSATTIATTTDHHRHRYVLEATDLLLQDGWMDHLLQGMQECTQRIQQLQAELLRHHQQQQQEQHQVQHHHQGSRMTTTTGPLNAHGPSRSAAVAQFQLTITMQIRQIIGEALYFLAYHTQWKASEVIGLLDRIEELSSLVPEANPFTMVPYPYLPLENTASASTSTSTSSSFSSWHTHQSYSTKSMHQWRQELVQYSQSTGQASSWHCLSLLIVTAQAALDGTQSLWCRTTHRYLPTGNTLMQHPDGKVLLQGRLDPHHSSNGGSSCITRHSRPDIASLLATSYWLLKRTTPSTEPQPLQRSISAPSDYKAFTFTRCTLIPCLKSLPHNMMVVGGGGGRSVPPLNLTEFALATVTQSYTRYLDHALSHSELFPVSRQIWLIEEQEELQLRKDQALQQAQFAATWHGQGWNTTTGMGTTGTGSTTDTIPDEVDLISRPDCLDDIIAVAITLAGLGTDYANTFYTTGQDDDDRRSMCATLIELGSHAGSKDPSLLPSYLSWMAALCQDATTASIVHSMLRPVGEGSTTISASTAEDDATAATMGPSSTNTTVPPPIDYRQIIANLAWYAQELSPYGSSSNPSVTNKTTANGTQTKTDSNSNTAYYYNLDGDSGYGSTTAGAAGSYTTGSKTPSDNSNNKSKVQELSNTSRYYLGSHLALLRNVAQHSSQARLALLKIVLPLDQSTSSSNSGTTAGDETLLILFQLAMAPLPPTLRGATLATIASLLLPSPDLSPPDQAFLLEQARRGWEYMENCPLLPIPLLDQYTTVDLSKSVGLAMPPSSLKLANTSTTTTTATSSGDFGSLLPKDPMYGLLYEMEHVESKLGWYPATEGCLEVLSSLIQTAGCPSTLGHNWRIRTGAAPYVEYVTDFVLPRALGTQGIPKLPFRVPGDESRLVTKALHVIQIVLVRYAVPAKALNLAVDSVPSTAVLGMPSMANRWTWNVHDDTDVLVADFENKTVSSSLPPPSHTSTIVSQAAPAVVVGPLGHIPRAKSPGFAVLADLLSSSARGGILEALAIIISGSGGASGIHSIFGTQGDKMAAAYAAFGSTVPDLSSAMDGAQEGGPTKSKQSLLKALYPHIHKLVVDDLDFDHGVRWRESSIQVALEILCAAAVREDAFFAAIASTKHPIKIVPTLRFQKIRFGSSNLKIVHVSPSRLSTLLSSSSDAQYVRSAIVECIGYAAVDDETDAQLSSAALCLTYFMHSKIRSHGGMQALAGAEKPMLLANSTAARLLTAAERSSSPWDTESTSLILNLILAELRMGTVTDGGLAQVLLGLPSTTHGGNWIPDKPALANTDCFDAILEIVHGMNYVASNEQSSVASMCLEILFRLFNLAGNADIRSLRIAAYTAQRLRAIDFWNTNLVLWLSSRGPEPLVRASSLDLRVCNPDALHCIAWLLKGVACELNLLIGFANSSLQATDATLAGLISPRPIMCQQLLDLLFSSDEPLIINLIHNLPLENVTVSSTSVVHPPDDAVRKGVQNWPGPGDVAGGYYRVNKEIVLTAVQSELSNDQDVSAMGEWIDEWNNVVARNCAASHLSSAVVMMLDSASAGNEAFSPLGNGSALALVPPTVLVGLSALMVDRLLEGSEGRISHGMDTSLYANSTRNMSNAVLCLVDAFVSLDNGKRSVSAMEILHLISLLARAVAYSSIGDNSDAEAPTRYERTIVLANAMSLLLRAIAHDEPDLLLQYQEDLLLAARALANLASLEVSANSPESSSVVSILARNSLASLVEICSEYSDGHGTSFVFQLLSLPMARSFSDLVARMDSSICSLLEVVASQPHGAEILVNARVLDAMESAASSYALREAEMMAKIQQAGQYRKTKVVAPDFLMSHLKLLVTVLASSPRSSSSSPLTPSIQGASIPEQALRILGLYKNTFQRLCLNFPFEADVLRAYLRCLVQATFVAMSSDPSQRLDITNISNSSACPSFPHAFAHVGFFESGLLVLCRHLLEHPLPASLLPQVPPSLGSPPPTDNSGDWVDIVKLESNDYHHQEQEQQTWWDVLKALLKNTKNDGEFRFAPPTGSNDWFGPSFSEDDKWSENTFEYAIVAADILGLSLTLMQTLRLWEDHLDLTLVCRGMHQYILATKNVYYRLDNIRPETTVSHPRNQEEPYFGTAASSAGAVLLHLEADYLSVLGRTMARNVESLLLLLLLLLGDHPADDDDWSKKENRRLIVSSKSTLSLSQEARRSLLRSALEPLHDNGNDGDNAPGWAWLSGRRMMGYEIKNHPTEHAVNGSSNHQKIQIEQMEFVRAITKQLTDYYANPHY